MANFEGLKFTRYGLELLGIIGAGKDKLTFTRVVVGSGRWTAEQQDAPADLTDLVDSQMNLAMHSITPLSEVDGDKPAGGYVIKVVLTNAGLEAGFQLREMGLFANHPSRGEILYAVTYTGDNYDYVSAAPSGAATLEKQFNIRIATGDATEVTIKQTSALFAMEEDLDDHNTDPKAHMELLARLATGTPEILFPANGAENIGETPIYRFRQFAPVFEGTSEEAIQVQIDLKTGTFANPVHDSGFLTTIAAGYEQPAGMLQAGETKYKIRYRRRLNTGQISEWSEVVVFETRNVFNYVSRPSNVSPSNGATGVMETPKLVSSAFAVVGDANDVHAATQYRMRIGDTVLHLSPELGAVTEYDFPMGLLLVSDDYVWEVRYKGTALGWSEWSTATSFHTAAAFITGDEAISFTSWDGYDNASAAGVAQADGAALRSNGVDQEADEGDWAKIKLRAKIRHAGEALLTGTSKTSWASPRPIAPGTKLGTDLGIVTTGTDTLAEGGPTGFFRTVYPGNEPVHRICTDKNGVRWGCGSASTVYKFATDGSITPIAVAASHMRDICATPDGTVWLVCDSYSPNRVLKKAPDSDSFVPVALSGVSLTLPMALTVFNGQLLAVNETDAQIRKIDANGAVSNWGTALPVTGTNYYFAASSVGLIAVCYKSGYRMYFSANGSSWQLINAATPGAAFITDDGTIYWGPKKRGPADSEFTNHNLGVTLLEVTSSALVGYDASQQLKLSEAAHLIDISSAGFESAPTRVYVLPRLMAATGNAAQAFTADDFSEIAIATATTGTDADADNPKFILLESIIEVLETSARRVALCVSGLLAGALVKNSETQADVWKQG